jgi:hypothetical protein
LMVVVVNKGSGEMEPKALIIVLTAALVVFVNDGRR